MTLEGKLFCSIYKSPRREGMYLYVERTKGLKDLPEALISQFGAPRHVTDMILTPERPLARVEVDQVMARIREQGFYLQMPPPPDEDLYLANGHPDRPRHA
ncbi:YcgL domain-containing protein [Alloalcanivorax sp. C16-2]|uniref:YcgL domain-containing protein n=1 Tax=Alloalcanivorax TaxID=3020832 RepID=UPI0019344279|nr:YcgL domain-containing protein [Alloalcanivorax marinus]MBL7249500.1 YcgL domain-containing protein [Alloalcanivorax marinus]